MTFNPPRQAFLVTTRHFPLDPLQLQFVLTKMYFDIAQATNFREIGLYENVPTNTGQNWLNNGLQTNRQIALRQVYTIAALPSSGTATIPTGIDFINSPNTQFVNIKGVAQSSGIAVAFTPWDQSTANDAPYLRVNISTGNIEIITTSANWTSYSGIIVLEYILK